MLFESFQKRWLHDDGCQVLDWCCGALTAHRLLGLWAGDFHEGMIRRWTADTCRI